MPSYDFICRSCDRPFEKRMSMSAYERGEDRECPSCGSTDVERAFTAVNVICGGGRSDGSGGSCGASGFT